MIPSRLTLALTIAALLGGLPTAADSRPAVPWIVDARRARRELARGALVLDVRASKAFGRGHLAGAVSLRWELLARKRPAAHRGLLASRTVLQRQLRRAGVRADRTVLVVGDPRHGWGEDGRVVWALRSAGQRRTALVDGGHAALVRAGAPLASKANGVARRPTHFVVRPTGRWLASIADVRAGLRGSKRVQFVDTRQPEEFRGATPWGERRGGHLVGAKLLHYKSLLDAGGRLRSRASLKKRLARAGLDPRRPIIAYCTGGVRSAWLVVVLVHLGYRDVRNYAGSMWQWSALPAATHPLQKTRAEH